MRWHIWSMLAAALLVLTGSIRADEPAPAGEEPIYQGKTLMEWIADLKDPKWETQRTAAQSLAVFGAKKEVVSALTTALKNDDAGVVLPAAQALGKFGLKAKEALPELRAAYKRLSAGPPPLTGNKKYSEEYLKIFADARQAVAEALILIDDHPGPELAPILLEALKTGDADKRRDIVIKLGKLGPSAAKTTVPVLIGILKDTDEVSRQASSGGLAVSGRYSGNSSISGEKAIEIRLEAIKSLGRIGPAAKPALHALTLAMKLAAPEKNVRVQQLEVLDRVVGSPGAHQVRTISFTIVTSDKTMLRACAEALGRIRPEAKGTMAALRLALRDLDEDVRWAALCTLLESGQDMKEVVPILWNFVHNKDAAFRRVAIQALGKSGSETKRIVPELTAALKDEDASVRASAAEAAGEVGPKAKTAVPALIAALKDAEAEVRKSAAEALRKIGVADKEVIQTLIAVLEDKEKTVFQAAGKALIKFGPQAKAAMPRLLALLSDSVAETRAMSCFVLASIGPPAKEAVSSLEKIAKDDSTEYVRLAAYTALARIDPSRLKNAIPRLTAALQRDVEKDTDIMEIAALGLILIGREDREVLPNLRKLRDKTSKPEARKVIDVVIKAFEHPEKDIFDLDSLQTEPEIAPANPFR